jgi:hypothetical protein
VNFEDGYSCGVKRKAANLDGSNQNIVPLDLQGRSSGIKTSSDVPEGDWSTIGAAPPDTCDIPNLFVRFLSRMQLVANLERGLFR